MGDVDVLIVGAGPTGGMLALELAQQGISFRIIDALAARSDQSRALAVQSRSLELLSRHGVTQELLRHGRVAGGMRVYANRKKVVEFDFADVRFEDTAFPTPVIVSQADTEGCMDRALERYGRGGCVERPVVARRLEQDQEGVTAWLSRPDGTEEEQVRCKYVVGCDGAHSVVRKSAGIEFGGGVYPQDFILADVHLVWEQQQPEPPDRIMLFMGSGVLAYFPMKDGVSRIFCSRPTELNNDAEPTLKDFQDVASRLVPGHCELSDPVWISRFRLHHRIAGAYRAGRMFVAGDAAHIHSPAGGQGMNTGIQDAANLGWKLARVIRGEKEPSLLDTYDLERRKIGETLLRGTDRVFELVTMSNPIYIFLRNTLVPWVLPWALGDRATRMRRFRFMSQLGIRYRQSPIVGAATTYKGILQGGDRAPDGTLQRGDSTTTTIQALFVGPAHHLVLFSGTGSDDAMDDEALENIAADFLVDSDGSDNGWVKVHKILNVAAAAKQNNAAALVDVDGKLHARYGFKEPSYVLVRPDGHIAYIGPCTAMEDLKTWVKT